MIRKTAYLTEKEKIEIRKEEIPALKMGEVLIRIHSIGICGSDVSYYTKGATGLGSLTYPHILGHECAGEIAAVGSGVSHVAVGARVAIEPGVPCGTCEYCRTGRYNLCESIAFMSSAIKRPGGEGGMAEYVIRPAAYVYRIPECMTYDQGALLEPVSVAIHAVRRSGIKPGQSAAILGCGPIAGCILLVLNACGVTDVWMTDVIEQRTEFMKSLGAKDVLRADRLRGDELKEICRDKVHAVFDTSCNETALNAALHWLKKGGSMVLVGVPAEARQIDLPTVFSRELSLISTFRYANTYPEAIALIEGGKLKPEVLISHWFDFENADEAMKKASFKKDDVMKIMIRC